MSFNMIVIIVERGGQATDVSIVSHPAEPANRGPQQRGIPAFFPGPPNINLESATAVSRPPSPEAPASTVGTDKNPSNDGTDNVGDIREALDEHIEEQRRTNDVLRQNLMAQDERLEGILELLENLIMQDRPFLHQNQRPHPCAYQRGRSGSDGANFNTYR